MKNLLKFLFLFLTLGVIFNACDDDDEINNPPTIKDFELGSGHANPKDLNNGQAYAGRDFHMSCEIIAKNKIAKIEVIISKDGEATPTDGWQYTLYDEAYAGQLNAEFHEHIIIEKNADKGTYQLLFKITDTKNLSAEINRDLEILSRQKKN